MAENKASDCICLYSIESAKWKGEGSVSIGSSIEDWVLTHFSLVIVMSLIIECLLKSKQCEFGAILINQCWAKTMFGNFVLQRGNFADYFATDMTPISSCM